MTALVLFFLMAFFPILDVYAQSQGEQPPASSVPEYSLNDLYKIALERSERIKISEEDRFISERDRDRAFSAILPKLSAFGSYTRYTEDKFAEGFVIQPITSTSWGLKLDQSFSLSGREFTALNISKENIERSGYDLSAVRESHLFSVSSAYYDVLRAKKNVDIAKANVERLTKHRDAASVRLKVGEVTKTALLRAEAELSGALSDQIKAVNGLESAKAVLARVSGIIGDFEVTDSEQQTAGMIETETIESLKQTAFSERAELKSLEIQKKIGEEQVRYAQGAYWPTLSLEGVYSRREDDPATIFLIKESVYGGLRLDFPIFEGGLRRAEVKEAEARQRQILFAYEDRKKAISVEVKNAYLDLITQKGIMEQFGKQTAYAEDNYNAVSKQFQYGIANSIDVMDANTLLVTAERQLADAQYAYRLGVLKLEQATGTLLKTTLSQIK